MARRDPGAQLNENPLVCLPNRTLLMIPDVVESSQLMIEEQSALAEVTCMTMHGTMIIV